MMELQQLKYFKKVAETGKIATAAEALYISSPALSTTISRLERELGYKLFDRHGSWIALNRQGEIFLRYVNQVFTSLECANTELAQSVMNLQSQVSIAVTTSEVWAEMLTEFVLAHPEINMASTALKLSQLGYLSIPGQYAFLLAESGDLRDTNLESKVLFTDAPVLMVHPDHPLAARESVDLREIQGQRLFLPMPGESFNKRLRALLAQAEIPAENVYECGDMIIRNMVMSRRGVAFSTRYTDPDPDVKIRYIPISWPVCRWEQRIYWDKNAALSREEAAFKAYIIDFYGHWRQKP